MTPVLLTPPASEPLSLTEIKAWLRIDGAEEDATLAALVTAARMTVERQSGRLLNSQAWRLIGDLWPTDGVLRLPVGPVSAVTAVRVFDSLGAATTVSPSTYRLEAARGRLIFTQSPTQPGRLQSGVEVDLTCGYGAAATDAPEPLRHAIRLLAARWFERRGDEPADGRALPGDVKLLIAPFRAPRLA